MSCIFGCFNCFLDGCFEGNKTGIVVWAVNYKQNPIHLLFKEHWYINRTLHSPEGALLMEVPPYKSSIFVFIQTMNFNQLC